MTIFGPKLLSGVVLEVLGSIDWLQEAPRQRSKGVVKIKSRPRKAQMSASKSPRRPKKTLREAHLEALGSNFGVLGSNNLTKI